MKYDCVGFGACGVDVTIQVPKLPQKNTKVLAQNLTMAGGGVTANNLVQCSKLGMKTAWLGILGNDELATYSLQQLQEQKVAVPLELVAPTPTGQFYIVNDADGNNIMVGAPFQQKFITPKLVRNKFTSIIKNSTCLHLEIAITSLAATYQAAQIAKKNGTKILLDIDMFPESKVDLDYFYKIIKLCDVVKTSASLHKSFSSGNTTEVIKKLYSYGPKLAVMTLGHKGNIAFDGEKIHLNKGLVIKTVDTAGAGDAFMGGLSYGLLKNWPIDKVLKFANICGAYKCQHSGTRSSGSIQKIKNLYAKHYGKI